jgi:hypothetical protein
MTVQKPDRMDVEEWIRVHRLLMEKEASFTDLALRAASGSVPLEELDAERQELMRLRAQCTSVYEKAFPKPMTSQ